MAFTIAALVSSAFLLFTLEFYFAKMVLPVFGGVPAVWNTCMVFFQTMLLAGYAYAHVLTRRFGLRVQIVVHAAVLAAACCFLPVRLPEGWSYDGAHPAGSLILLMLRTLGLPFFALSATAPLLQKWFSRTSHARARDPYFLYAASNAGSFSALAYPFFIEPFSTVRTQSTVWAVFFAATVLAVVCCAAFVWRHAALAATVQTASPLSWARKLKWLWLAFVPSSLTLGLTTYITTDVGSVPLVWAAVLGLYLATFVWAFSGRPAQKSSLAGRYFPYLMGILGLMFAGHVNRPLTAVLPLHFMAFFTVALLLHRRLAADRPETPHLTEFYLWISLGGALGGLFNALAAPVLFPLPVEYPLVMAAACWTIAPRPVAVLVTACALFGAWFESPGEKTLLRARSFFGAHKVTERAGPDGKRYRFLYNGRIIHGLENLTPGREEEVLGYYHMSGACGDLFKVRAAAADHSPVAVIGLGVGTLAAYAQAGEVWDFYEIDPVAVEIARDSGQFSFLSKARTSMNLILGDGRLSIAKAENEKYGLIFVDAFSSDSVPAHLLTREAIDLYFSKLKPGGTIAFQVSNQHLRLDPVLGAYAESAGIYAKTLFDVRNAEDAASNIFDSRWVVMAREAETLKPLEAFAGWTDPERRGSRVWTDDFSNLAAVIDWRVAKQR